MGIGCAGRKAADAQAWTAQTNSRPRSFIMSTSVRYEDSDEIISLMFEIVMSVFMTERL